MKSMNRLVKTQPHTLKMMVIRVKEVQGEKGSIFDLDKDKSPFMFSFWKQGITRGYEEIEGRAKTFKHAIQEGMNDLLRALHPALLKLLLMMNRLVITNDGNPKFRIIQQHLHLLIKLITKQMG